LYDEKINKNRNAVRDYLRSFKSMP
jgi:hypothetical protein